LFTAIGTAYGVGNGSTTFNLPDFRGRVPVGLKATDADFDALGDTYGSKTHTLTTAEMPTHNHGVTDPGHGHSITMTWSGGNDPVGGNKQICTDSDSVSGPGTSSYASAASATTGISINNAGSSSAHNNVQPSLVINFIIKY
jgi:microcystin-dependent protein